MKKIIAVGFAAAMVAMPAAAEEVKPKKPVVSTQSAEIPAIAIIGGLGALILIAAGSSSSGT